MIYTGIPIKIQFYNNTSKKSIAQVKNELGCDIIFNGSLFDMTTYVPCCDIKIDGKILSNDQYSYWGYGWNNDELPYMISSANINQVDNYISCIWAITKGKKETLNNNASGVGGSRARTAFGFTAEGKIVVLCTADKDGALTLTQTRDKLFENGCVDGIILDGGGSSQMICPDGKVTRSRKVSNFICVWLAETGSKISQTSGKITTTTGEYKINEPNYTWNGSLSTRKKTNYIVLHHAANTSQTPEEIHAYHKSLGWTGIGYNYYVRKDGSIYRGRPEKAVGAHCTNYNSQSIGVCAEGNYETTTEMPQAQKEALKWLVQDIKSRYPSAQVKRHKDLQATACPGKYYPFDYITSSTTTTSSSLVSYATQIRIFQNWLRKTYKLTLSADGTYGAKTKAAAIRAFQMYLNTTYKASLATDGVWGNKTKSAVKIMRKGDRGNNIYIMQGMLYCLGYDVGGFDGVFGASMAAAVKQFQQDNRIAVDGIIGGDTAGVIFGA